MLRFWPLAAAATLVAIAVPASAGPVPDAARLAHLQKRADAAWRVKVTTAQGTWLVSEPRMDADGVTLVRGTFGETARRLTWADIDGLETQPPGPVRRALGGALIGAGAGLVVGLVAFAALGDADGSVIVPILSTGAGTAVGAAVGLAWKRPVERLYP